MDAMDSRKMAAAIAAVEEYMQQEAAAMTGATIPGSAEGTKTPSTPLRLWGLSGRQELMQTRQLMQMRAFKGS